MEKQVLTASVKRAGANLLQYGLQLLYPRKCPLCDEILTDKTKAEQNPFLCRDCYPQLLFAQGTRCLLCSRPLTDERATYCPDCNSKIRFFDQGISLLVHEDTAKKIIYDLKFSNRRDHADALAYETAERYLPLLRYWNPQALVPVPLHAKRERERGFNQAALLAKKLSSFLAEKGLDIPVDEECLKRVRHTAPQKELDHTARMQNVTDAFQADNRQGYSCVLLIDDIFTTGSTLSECARVLKEACVTCVYSLTFSIV